MRIAGIADRETGKSRVIEGKAGLVPEISSNHLIVFLNGPVFLLEIFPECRVICRRIIGRNLAVDLVVQLPADDGRMTAKMGSHGFDKPVAFFQVDRTCHIVVLSHAVAVGIALYGGVQRFRVKPGRRRTGGGTENNLDSCFLCLIQETVKESKIINTLPGLKEIPGKLSHPGSFQAKLFHELEIFFPVGFSPVLRIIAHAGSDMVHF